MLRGGEALALLCPHERDLLLAGPPWSHSSRRALLPPAPPLMERSAVAWRSGGTETDLLQNTLPRVLAAPGNPLGGFQEQIKFIHGGIGTIFLL